MKAHNERSFGFIVDSMIKKAMNPNKDLMSIINKRHMLSDQIRKYSYDTNKLWYTAGKTY